MTANRSFIGTAIIKNWRLINEVAKTSNFKTVSESLFSWKNHRQENFEEYFIFHSEFVGFSKKCDFS
jgi:hypothetical protein